MLAFDAVLHALGEMESFNSLLAVQRKTTNIIDRQANNKIVEKDKPKNTFDQAIIQGQLQSSQTTKPLLSYHMRGGKPFPGPQGDPKLIWRIYGTKGEIQFTGPTCSLNVGYEEGFKIDVVDSSGKVVNVEVPKDDFLDGLSVPGRNISRLYEAFADGKSGYPDWNDALKRHRMLDEMERRADSGSQLLGAEYLKL